MKSSQLIIVSVVALFILAPNFTYAVGLTVEPARVLMIGVAGETMSETINITNVSADVGLFEVYVDEFERDINIMPESFVLEGDETRSVNIETNLESSQVRTTTLSIVATPLSDAAFVAGGGVKIPLTIEVGVADTAQSAMVIESAPVLPRQFMARILFVSLVLVLLYLLFVRFRQAL